MGKTNILDAINYLCLTRSNFSRLDKYNVQHGKNFARVEGSLIVKGKANNIVVKIAPGSRKVVERNAKAYEKLSDHIGRFPLVMIAPKDNVLILESSAERRKLIDRIIAQTNQQYLLDLISYNKLLDQRNALLKSDADRKMKQSMLDAYNERMAPLSRVIYEERINFIKDLTPIFVDLYKSIANNDESSDMIFKSQLEKFSFQELAAKNLEKDLILKRTSAGAHKDDILFSINETDVKNYASQGQLKSLVLAFKLAQFVYLKSKTETTPIILLDDVFDKLDRTRVKHLVDLLIKKELGQVFISDTDEQRIEQTFYQSGLDYKRFNIDKGNLINENNIENGKV